MEKRISYSQFQSVKCVAKACDPLISKRAKLKEKIDKLTAEYDDCDTQIKSLEAGIVTVIGFPVDMLVRSLSLALMSMACLRRLPSISLLTLFLMMRSISSTSSLLMIHLSHLPHLLNLQHLRLKV